MGRVLHTSADQRKSKLDCAVMEPAHRPSNGRSRTKAGGPARSADVATLAGVHRSTVSRVMNPATAHLVNEATRRRVLAAVDELGYRTNTIAQGLRMRRSLTVGVIIPDITNPLFPPIVRAIDDTLSEYGYTSLVGYSDGDADRASEYLERFQQRDVDGLLVATAQRADPALEQLSARGVPLVQVNRRSDNDDIPYVIVDDRAGIRAAVEHLAALGHVRVACLAAPQSTSTGRDRFVHFRAAAEEHGIQLDRTLLLEASAVSQDEGRRLCRQLLRQSRPPTAIVAANDTMALGCIDALRQHGLRCPDDVSIVGFNDMQFADRLSPALTTVRFDHYRMGASAARILLGRMGTAEADGDEQIALPSELVVRDSTAGVQTAATLRPRSRRPSGTDVSQLAERIGRLEVLLHAALDRPREEG